MTFDSMEERLLLSTVRIESLDDMRNPISIGTGFIIFCKIKEDGHKAYLVSNKHVLLESDYFRISFIKRRASCNEPDLGKVSTFRFQYSESYIALHPDEAVDVAVIDMTAFVELYHDSIFFRPLTYDMLATCNEEFLHVSQSVSFVGYPDDRYDIETNLPLMRSATIASPPSLDFNGERTFVVDGQIFPGSSGSPVMINIAREQWKAGKLPQRDIPEWLLLGIVSQTMVRYNELKNQKSSLIKLLAKNAHVAEVLGLGIIFKSTTIKETLDIAIQKFAEGDVHSIMMVWEEP